MSKWLRSCVRLCSIYCCIYWPYIILKFTGKGRAGDLYRGTDAANNMQTSPRLIRTHLPVQFIPKSVWEQNSKVSDLCVASNSKAVGMSVEIMFKIGLLCRLSTWLAMQKTVWSPISILNAWAWYHRSLESGMTLSRDSWMERVCIQYSNMSSCIWGDVQWFFYSPVVSVVFGSWYDHVNNWWMKKQTHAKLHFMFYEDIIEVIGWLCGLLLLYVFAWFHSVWWFYTRLIWRVTTIFPMCFQDTRREINKLCSFLGLSPSPEKMEMIIDKVKFENMKTNDIVNNKSFQGLNFKISSFMRKGTAECNTVYNVSS